MALEELFRGTEDGPHPDYDAARKVKVAAIAEAIRDDLLPNYAEDERAVQDIAEDMMNHAEEGGHIYGDGVNVTLHKRYSRFGREMTYTI